MSDPIDQSSTPPAATHAAAAAPRPLDYGRGRKPWRLRKRHILAAFLLAGCVAGSWVVGREARSRTQTLLYAHQAARHVEPADTVVFEPDPLLAAGLLRGGEYVPLRPDSPAPAAKREPDSFNVFRSGLARQSLEAFGAMVFLHELTTPSGVRRVVAVHYLPYYLGDSTAAGAGLVARVFEPGGFVSAPAYVGDAHARLLVPESPQIEPEQVAAEPAPHAPPGALPDTLPVRWFAGQPDESDASHFTIDFELDGVGGTVHGTVDGYLTDDGGSVRMQSRAAGNAAGDYPFARAAFSPPQKG